MRSIAFNRGDWFEKLQSGTSIDLTCNREHIFLSPGVISGFFTIADFGHRCCSGSEVEN
jgi:hypothetical protein